MSRDEAWFELFKAALAGSAVYAAAGAVEAARAS